MHNKCAPQTTPKSVHKCDGLESPPNYPTRQPVEKKLSSVTSPWSQEGWAPLLYSDLNLSMKDFLKMGKDNSPSSEVHFPYSWSQVTIPSKLVFSTGQCWTPPLPQWTSVSVWRPNRRRGTRASLAVSGEWRARMLLNTLKGIGNPLQDKELSSPNVNSAKVEKRDQSQGLAMVAF